MGAILIYKLGAGLAQSLSLPAARKLAAVVGRLMCYMQRRNRAHLMHNLEVAFGDELSRAELKALRRKIFQNFAVFVTDFLRMSLVTRENLTEFVTEDSLDAVRRIIAAPSGGRGAVVTSAHVGNWEMGAAACGLMDSGIKVLVDFHPNRHVTAFFDRRREDKGIDPVPVSAFHRCFRALKGGGLVAVVGDRAVTGQGVRVPYFGREALMPDGHAVIARRFGAPLVPMFTVLEPDGRYRCIVDELIVPRVTDDVEADILDTIHRVIELMERYIRKYPEQWYVFQPIWSGERAALLDRLHLRRMRAAQRAAQRAAGKAAQQP